MKLLFTFGWALKKWCGLNSVQKKKKKKKDVFKCTFKGKFH